MRPVFYLRNQFIKSKTEILVYTCVYCNYVIERESDIFAFLRCPKCDRIMMVTREIREVNFTKEK